MARRHAVADQREQIVRERLRMRELQPHQIIDRVPVGMNTAEMLKIGLGFLFRGPADDVREGEHIHGATSIGGLPF